MDKPTRKLDRGSSYLSQKIAAIANPECKKHQPEAIPIYEQMVSGEITPNAAADSLAKMVKTEFCCDPSTFMDFIKPLIPQDLRDGLREALYPDEQGKRTDLDEDATLSQNDTKLGESPEITEKRTRAISRAPRIVRELYDSDLLGINEAVKLGPRVNRRKPTPEQIEAKDENSND